MLPAKHAAFVKFETQTQLQQESPL